MKQTLYLLRHAKAEPWTPGCDDFNRPLSNKGREHMEKLSRWMIQHLSRPDAVLCSTSSRTRGTLEPLLNAYAEPEPATHYLDAIYEATAGRLHGLAEQSFERFNAVLMVGHNPGFENLLFSLLVDQDSGRIGKMATGSLGVIEFGAGYQADFGHGVLRHWVTRKSLID